jgi:uncharacterized protein YndB with AHSA1/START domain/DNA-binding transcriptional ArsR family regulator
VDKFTALSDATRRKIIEMLANGGPLPASVIYEQFPVSPPAISQHLKVLREAGLVRMQKHAQQRIYSIDPGVLHEVEDWASQMARLWNQRFDALDRVLEIEKRRVATQIIERSTGMQGPITQELTLTRVFDAPRELVFKAWTDPRLVAEWWGPHGFTNPVVELDLHPGGAIYILMRLPDGRDNPMKGTFHEIVPPERLVFTSTALEDEAGNPQLEVRNTVTFAEQGSQTLLTLHAMVVHGTAEAAVQALAGMEAGWSQSLEKLTAFLARRDSEWEKSQ